MTSKHNTKRRIRGMAKGAIERNAFSFRYFKEGIENLMYLDRLTDEEKEDYTHEWYIIFKEQGHETVKEFVEWNFPKNEVNEDSHNYWKK